MGKNLKYIIIACTLTLFFVGSSLFVKAEYVEGNTTVRNAYTIPHFPFQLILNFENNNDIRWFKVNLNETQALKLKADNNYWRLDYQVYTEDELKKSNPTPLLTRTLEEDYSYYKLEAGVYYIKIYPYTGSDWKEKDITLIFDSFDDDRYEPNDTHQQATEIQLGNPMTIRLSGDNDVDWFKVSLNETQALKLKADSSYWRLDYQFYTEDELKKSNPTPLLTRSLEEDYSCYKLEAGVYYIKIYPYTGSDWKGKDITLTFDSFNDDRYEPNDTYQQATEIQLGNPMTIRLSGDNDVDWFKVRLDQAKALKIKADNKYYRVDYQVYTEDELKKSNPAPLLTRGLEGDYSYHKLEAGVYYIKIYPFSYPHTGNDWKGKDIGLLIDCAVDDQFEYNDTWETAKNFPLSQEYEININAPMDVDWFKFTLSESKDLRLSLNSNYWKTFNYWIYKENDSSNAINSGSINSNNGNIGVSLGAGSYRLKLSGNDNNYSEQMMKFMIGVVGEDLERPSVSKISPIGSHQDVNKNIEITFSKTMDKTTLTKDNFTLKWFNDEVEFELDYLEGENKVVLIPTTSLNYASDYTVTVSKDVKARGNQLTMLNDYTWTFKTREKRLTDNEVGTISGKVTLDDYLQRLAMAGEVSLYQGNKKVKTVYPDRYGKFSFGDVNSGVYTLKVDIPGFLSDSKDVTVNYGDDLNVTLKPTLGDLNGDGIIDLYDITEVSKEYNRENQ